MKVKLSKKSPITFVELPPTLFGKLNGSTGYDVYSMFRLPSRSIPHLAGVLKADGWNNIREINPLYNGLDGKLSKENMERIFSSDALLLSSITRTSMQSMELARLYKSRNPDGIVIAGGCDPTFRAEEWMKHTDIVVRGEGEATIKELLNRLTEDTKNLENIDGIVSKDGDNILFNKPRKLLDSEELSNLPRPYYNEETMKKVSVAVLETTRGCPNDCDFCTVNEFYGRRYRFKSIDYVLEELTNIKEMGKALFITDDNFAAVPQRTIELLDKIKEKGIGKKLTVQVTVKTAFNEELLKAFKRADVKPLCVGIESINDETLRGYNKKQSVKEINEAVKIFKDYGFWIHGMMIAGGEGDDLDVLKETGKWANDNLDSLQLFSPLPVPGTKFYERMENEGRILTKDWFLYDGQHVVIRPKNLKAFELQEGISNVLRNFYSLRQGFKKSFRSNDRLRTALYYSYVNVFRMMNKVINNPQSKVHLEFLKSLN